MESEHVDGWIGTWTVQMSDGSTETWEITHSWVSKTRKSHMGYGIKKPGNVEFQIYFGTMFKKYSYIEASHETAVTDLPLDFANYTDLVPADDFASFTAKSGKYPIENGIRVSADAQHSRPAPVVGGIEGTVRTDETIDQPANSQPQKKDAAPFETKSEPVRLPEPMCIPGEMLIGIEGNQYRTITIGKQTWMAENLRTTTYRDGTAIASPGADNDAWERNTEGAYSLHDNRPENKPIYGLLYNWAAVINPRALCPEGWHIPTDAEWQTLVDCLGGDDLAGGAMKSEVVDPAPHPRWDKPNTGATNISGFSGLPGGLRRSNGTFREIGSYGAWWSATDGGSDDAWHRSIFYSDTRVYHFIYGKGSGMSIRCVRD
jgi:uncharacterized protein (TIGR02145 family)